tara:strand:+ start:1630 stop:1821 length:192 start_codon:yes stop_codon:yes gene_type:complete
MGWEYEINEEDEYMIKCNHIWVDKDLDYYHTFWDDEIGKEIVVVAFSHCKVCGAQRRKTEYGE